MAINKRVNRHIRAVWDKFSSSDRMSTVTLEEVKAFVEEKGLVVESIEEVEFGWNPSIKAIKLKADVCTALYPREKLDEIKSYKKNIAHNQNYENFWRAVDWFVPPYVPQGTINDTFSKSGINVQEHTRWNNRLLQERFEPYLSSIYTLGDIIPITLQVLTESSVISKHLPVIKESILAFYSGMKVSAIASLIPIVEDVLGSIIGSEDCSKFDTLTKVNKSIDKACDRVVKLHINNCDWVPNEYIESSVLKVMNERIFILETIRSWLLNSFYVKTENYDNHSGFNRHFFAHAKSDIWQNTHNFFRAIGLIQALAFIECFAVEGSKVRISIPRSDARTESFRLEVFACLNFQLLKKDIINQLQIDNNLPFNPIASDDGWLMRAAKLSDCMNSEIIPRLRDNGWQCHSFIDPVQDGEYISVEATRGSKNKKIALLYSCATSNSVYKELDKSCDIILYQGSYYKQDSYAYGVNAEISPLSAWLAPN
ncbi:hypothetical protein [Pseudoalteromonas sp. Z1A8]|uniref:hypothetical protein n=1 Tax=Pseudoalteromonas sp. Z1A8 TaxID=2686354 RepID=UPI00198258E9|nr:hypothetical protein [Pseudoalteromonas sp. Z1A8]